MEKARMNVGIPEGMTINSGYDGLTIERRWYTSKTLFYAGFAVIWNAFLFNWYREFPGFDALTEDNIMTYLFPVGHVAVGVGLIYYVVAGFLNKTTVTVSHSNVESKISPIPFGLKKVIPAPSIEQVYCKEVTKSSKNGESVTFEVRVIQKDRKNTCLVSGLETSEQALFLEHEIESYLGIKDVSVKGELG
ncbi:hypothetical protein BIT28_12250 [Photobacterium proteolyticum]|uniref:Uncharacterized protein n=1 Tax=Photobacterium proteolyticum TaxID=1903952 RepID=A0A1Q9GBG7_9GAMM|nr:hypothetical protein [Photobacterium proteolyticum]OLQ71678.1 hypothetical protein BIT28_12250 [Photobacterium proteolyticum]